MFNNYGNDQASQAQPQPAPNKVVRFDKSYIQSTPGILKLVEISCFWSFVPFGGAVCYHMLYSLFTLETTSTETVCGPCLKEMVIQITVSCDDAHRHPQLCNIVGFICIKVSPAWFSAILYNFLYWAGNIITLLLFFMYMFHFVEKLDKLPWLKFEFGFCAIMVLIYIGCSIFATTIGESAGYAVGFFGLCAIIAYGMDGYLKYRAYKRGLPAQ